MTVQLKTSNETVLCTEESLNDLHYTEERVAWDTAAGGTFSAQYLGGRYRVTVKDMVERVICDFTADSFLIVLDTARHAHVVTADTRAAQSIYMLDLL